MSKKKKIAIAITVPVLVVVIVIASVLGWLMSFNYQKGEVQKATSIELPDNGVVRVLQLTDLHLTNGSRYKQDKQTLEWVRQAVRFSDADIVAVTGDAVGGLAPFRGRDKALIELAEIFEEEQVYWMYTFGNHDGEWSREAGAEVEASNENQGNLELYELLKGYKYSLMQKGDTDGVGNYVIDVVNGEGETVFGLINMDSHQRIFGADGKKTSDYKGLTANQITWYEEQINALNARGDGDVKSALFMHVPLFEYTDAVLNYPSTGNFESYFLEGKVYCQKENIGLYDKMQELGSTNFVSVGHDHDYNWLIDYNGIYFSYGRVSGVNAWSRRVPVGATVIDINTAATNLESMYKVFVMEPDFEYSRWDGWGY